MSAPFGQYINVSGVTLNAANTATDGGGTVGTSIFKVWQAGAAGVAAGAYANVGISKGGVLGQVRIKVLAPMGTDCVVRLFINNGQSNSVAANNNYIADIQLKDSENPVNGNLLLSGKNTVWIPDNMEGELGPGHIIYATCTENVQLRITGIGADW